MLQVFNPEQWFEEVVKDLRNWARELAFQEDPYPSRQAELLFDAVRIIETLRKERKKIDRGGI